MFRNMQEEKSLIFSAEEKDELIFAVNDRIKRLETVMDDSWSEDGKNYFRSTLNILYEVKNKLQ